MSLHLGNLSSRTRRDNLERVFRRYGRCTVQVKDRYGFVVYDYPACAEKALKALHGKKICGEPITLSWSNRQPRAPPHRIKQKHDRQLRSNAPRDHETGSKKSDGGKIEHPDVVDESSSYKLDHPSNDMEFDRYEPYQSDENEELAPESDLSLRSNAPNSAAISSEEMAMVLKHYGLKHPEESEKGLPLEVYLGSARLWPWEIIYYRRFKKGPVSAENYARRVSQNQEFGIVDKYIRSSSGWAELNQENT